MVYSGVGHACGSGGAQRPARPGFRLIVAFVSSDDIELIQLLAEMYTHPTEVGRQNVEHLDHHARGIILGRGNCWALLTTPRPELVSPPPAARIDPPSPLTFRLSPL